MADRHDDRSLEQALDRAWDESIRNAPAGSGTSDLKAVDPGLAATVRRVHALNLAPATDPSFADHLWKDLMDSQRAAGALAPYPVFPSTTDIAVPRLRPLGRPASTPQPRLQRTLSQLGIAALVLAMLGLGYIAYRAGFADDDPHRTAPAVVQSASPSPEPALTAPADAEGEPILEVVLPPEVMAASTDGPSSANLTVPPGDTSTWTGPQAALLHYVVSGALTVRPDAPAQVLRAGETVWAAAPAGSEIVLAPGDAVLLVDNVLGTYANNGSIPVETVTWLLPDERSMGDPIPLFWSTNDLSFDENADFAAHPGGSAVLQLRRIVLEPDAEIPAPPEGESRLRVGVPFNGEGTPVPVSLTRRENGYAANYGTESVLVYELTLEFAEPGPAGSPAASEGALVSVDVPVDWIHADAVCDASLVHFGIPAGTTTTWTSPKLRLEYIVSGNVAVRPNGAALLLRGGNSAPEELAAGTEVTLAPGDAMLSPSETTADFTTAADEPVELISWFLGEQQCSGYPVPRWWVEHTSNHRPSLTLSGDAFTLRLRRVELAPNEVLDAAPGVLQMGVTRDDLVISGTPVVVPVSVLGDGSMRNVAAGPVPVYVAVLEPR